MRLMALPTILLLGACSTVPTVAPTTAELGEAIDCTVKAPCVQTTGVWMPGPLANHLAGAEKRWRVCRGELEKMDAGPGLKTLGIVCGTCAAAGALTCGAVAGVVK